MNIQVLKGNIETSGAEIVVSSSNRYLRDTKGVTHAIHQATGQDLADYISVTYSGRPVLDPGKAVTTPSFNMLQHGTRLIVHVMGPIYDRANGIGDENLLRTAYVAAFDFAVSEDASSIALPAISAGAHGFPSQDVARIAIDVAKTHAYDGNVTFYCWDDTITDFEDALSNYGQQPTFAGSIPVQAATVQAPITPGAVPNYTTPGPTPVPPSIHSIVTRPSFSSKHKQQLTRVIDDLTNSPANGTVKVGLGFLHRMNITVVKELDSKALVFEHKGNPLAVILSYDEYQKLLG